MSKTGKSFRGLVWCGPVFDPSGYADEGRGMLCALDAVGEPVSLRPVHRIAPGFREGLPASERAILDRQVARAHPSDRVLVQHHTADAFFQMDGPVYHIGRTMFETDSIPASWVRHCNQMDELWLPSAFNIDTFRRAGVHVPIVRVPGGIDSEQFHPAVQPLAVPGLRGTVFLAVFEWRLRKGWDVLLRAWAEAFRPDEDVTLVLRTYPIDKSAGVDNETVINQRIDAFLEHACGRRRADVAPIVVLGRTVPGSEMPALYRIASALVAPTRGEGWGRPFMEAMATGLPVLATRWSAHLEFMNDENSLLIDVERLEQADGVEVPLYRGQRWAMPSATHLATLMRRVHEQPGEAKALGDRARRDMVEQWPWRRAATVMTERLREIRGRGELIAALSPVVRRAEPQLVVEARLFDARAADADTERVVSAIVRAWPHGMHVRSRAESLRRPSIGSPLFDGWRAMEHTSWSPAAPAQLPGVPGGHDAVVSHDAVITWLDPLDAGAPKRPATARWVVHTGALVSRSVPGGLVRTLRDIADDVWVPDVEAFAACRAAGVPADRVWLVPPLAPAPHLDEHGPRGELPQAADTVFLLPTLDAAQAEPVEALLRLWQRVFDANQSALLLVYAPDVGVTAVDAWQRQLIALLSSGRLLHGAPIRVLRDRLVGDELVALVRACDVVLDPLPSVATAAMRRMARGCGRRVVTGGGSAITIDAGVRIVESPAGAPFDTQAWREALLATVGRDPSPVPSEAARRAHRMAECPPDTDDAADVGAACAARLATVLKAPPRQDASTDSEVRAAETAADRTGAPSTWLLPEAREKTILAHVDWHDGSGGGVLRSYLESFSSADAVTLVLCLDPAQGVGLDDVRRFLHDAATVAGCDRDAAMPDIILVPDLITDRVRSALLDRCDVVVAVGDRELGRRAEALGRPVIAGLSTAVWRAAVARADSAAALRPN